MTPLCSLRCLCGTPGHDCPLVSRVLRVLSGPNMNTRVVLMITVGENGFSQGRPYYLLTIHVD